MQKIKELLKCFEGELSTSINFQTRNKLIEFLTNQGYTVYGGQKRLVVMDPQGYSVYKIACDLIGIQDNINEVACSERLVELCNEGVITRTDLTLFALASVEDGDPFVIKQEIGNHYDNDATFLDFHNKESASRGGQKSTADTFPLYVNRTARYANEYNRIMTIISNHFVASDVSIAREPRNYGFNPHSNSLVLFDMGSVIPMFKTNGVYDKPLCPACGQHTMVYTPFLLGNGMTDEKVASLGGIYGCTNPNCKLSIVSGKASLEAQDPVGQADQNVFNKYIREHMFQVNIMNLVHGYTWVPINPLNINNILDLRNDITNGTRGLVNITTDADMIKIWNNYMTRSSSIIISSMPELLEAPVANGQNLKTYSVFAQEIMTYISSKAPNTFKNVVINHLVAMLYLRALTLILGKYQMYADLCNSINYVQFREAMSRYVTVTNEAELQVLFNTLRGV